MNIKSLLITLLALIGLGTVPASASSTFTLHDINGHTRRLFAASSNKAIVLIFITDDCPISNSYAPEINRICAAYTRKKIAFYLVETDPQETAQAAKKHARDYGSTCPVLLDTAHRLVHSVGATVTPEVALFTPNGKRLYRGRIDNKYADFGQIRPQPTTHDLRAALDAALAGKLIPHSETKAIGCFI